MIYFNTPITELIKKNLSCQCGACQICFSRNQRVHLLLKAQASFYDGTYGKRDNPTERVIEGEFKVIKEGEFKKLAGESG